MVWVFFLLLRLLAVLLGGSVGFGGGGRRGEELGFVSLGIVGVGFVC